MPRTRGGEGRSRGDCPTLAEVPWGPTEDIVKFLERVGRVQAVTDPPTPAAPQARTVAARKKKKKVRGGETGLGRSRMGKQGYRSVWE